ncbi:MAG: hypothetical protein EH225_00910, partial [Calditrichaeota bacterium]
MKKVVCIISITAFVLLALLTSCDNQKKQNDLLTQIEPPAGIVENPDTSWTFSGSDTTAIPPSAGELEIISHGPEGETQGQVQIKIEFPRPLIPLTTLSDARRDAVLRHFTLEPRIEGRFRILGTSAVVFEPVHSLPMATDFTVTVTRGLRDLENYQLPEDFSWTFSTPLPDIRITPSNSSTGVDIKTVIQVRSSTALDMESLKEKTSLTETTTGKKVDFELMESDKNISPEQDIGMQRVVYDYFLKPANVLRKDTPYIVKIEAGLMTYRGNRPLPQPVISNFRTFPPFRFKDTGFGQGCGGHLTTRPYLSFTTRPEQESIKENILIKPETEEFPFYLYGYGANDIGINDYTLEPNTTYTIIFKENLKDTYGQNLENPGETTIVTGDLTPKMWGPQGYQIITPNIEPKLGIKTVRIPSAFYRVIALKPEHILFRERLDYYYSINKFMENIRIPEKKEDIQLNEEGIGKTFFDLSPYLNKDNFGAVAYSFKSPVVECYEKPIEFNGLLLRTNLGIFTQFHPTAGIIKVNQLTDGLPVAGTKIRLYREDDLPRLDKARDLMSETGPPKIQACFEGVTDENGLLVMTPEQMASCTKRRATNKAINELLPPEMDPDDIMYNRERFGFAEPP